MAISTAFLLMTYVGYQPSTIAPVQPLAEAPQRNAPANTLNVSSLPLAQAEETTAVAPDEVVAVEWSARSRESDPATLLQWGSHGPAVSRLQARLARLGYVVTVIDGKFGPQTQAAVREFQRSNGLVADGMLDASTWAKLNIQITQSGWVPLTDATQPPVVALGSSVLTSRSAVLVTTQPSLATATFNKSPSSPKNGWIVVLIIFQGVGWLIILQGLNKELVLLTGRSLFPRKKKQWLFSPRH